MGRPKEIKDGIRLSVVLSKAQAEQIARRARGMSVQEGRTISVSEAIRAALEQVYPVHRNQLNLFE